ncbi:MAG: hypothetical protein ACOCV8_01860 [Spirochaetota bacterium]
MGVLLERSKNQKVIKYRDKTIDLTKDAPGKIFVSGHRHFRVPLYRASDSEAITYFPLPSTDGLLYLFNSSKSELGSKGKYYTDMRNSSALASGVYGLIMALGVIFEPRQLDYRTVEALDSIKYHFMLRKDNNELDVPLLSIPQINSISSTVPERTLATADLVDGKWIPKSSPRIEKNKPMELDESRYLLLRPNEHFESWLEPEDVSATDNLPYPDSTEQGYNFRQWVDLYLFGLFAENEKIV